MTSDLPSPETELWRYTPIRSLDLAAYTLVDARSAGPDAATLGAVPSEFVTAVPERAALVVIVDGRLERVEVGDAAAAQGVTIEAVGEPTPETRLLPVPHEDALTALHDAFVRDVVVVRIPRGVVVDGAIVVVQLQSTPGGATFPHLVVDAGEQAEVTILDHWTSAGLDGGFVSPVVELQSGPAANVRYVCVQDLGPDVWCTGHLLMAPARDATTRAWVAALGGKYARIHLDAQLADQASTADIAGIYFGEDDQVHDFRSLQDHIGSRTVSNFLLKGAVVDHAHAIYTGMIRVHEGAKATESFLANRNLVLADGAHVDSVPNLEIVNENDIKSCGHAAATGPVDEEHVFYLESRGVPTNVAERLIVFGFFDDVVSAVPIAGVRDPLRQQIARKLEKAAVGA